MCKHKGESIDHLLLHCEVAIEVWNMVFQIFGVTWMMSSRIKEYLESWRGQRGNRTAIHIWKMAPLCVMWCL
jgi:hypothetical protein